MFTSGQTLEPQSTSDGTGRVSRDDRDDHMTGLIDPRRFSFKTDRSPELPQLESLLHITVGMISWGTVQIAVGIGRQFIPALGGATIAWPLAAQAQPADRVRDVGLLLAGSSENDPASQARLSAFRNALHELGWTEVATYSSRSEGPGPDELGTENFFAPELVAGGGYVQ